jgi:hypothetical protein
MIPQGSEILNTAVITSMTNRLNAVKTCADLQSLVDDEFASLGALKTAINDQLALLGPIEALLTAPTADLSKVVTWIQNYITSYLTPQLQPYLNYSTQLTQLTTAIATLTTAIEQKAAQIGSCAINIPAI